MDDEWKTVELVDIDERYDQSYIKMMIFKNLIPKPIERVEGVVNWLINSSVCGEECESEATISF